jgi:hypothetical protein
MSPHSKFCHCPTLKSRPKTETKVFHARSPSHPNIVSRPSFFSRGFSFAAIHHLLVKRINDPSYLTVMLNMMDDDDGFFLTLPLRGNLTIADEHLRSRPAPFDVGTFVALYSSWSLSHVRESPAVGWPQNSERSSI